MSYVEARTWFAYIRKYGPLNVGRKLESAIEYHLAQLCMVVNRSQGGKSEMKDFMPSMRKPQETETTPEALFAMLQAAGRTS